MVVNEGDKYVYHGSVDWFETAIPRRNLRSREVAGKREVIFDDISFHATPERWIALAYISKRRNHQEKENYHSFGVDLYEDKQQVALYGYESLEKSLAALFGDGGYLYKFDKNKFFHTAGLGNLEVITKEIIKPLEVEKIADPVRELENLGIKFTFFDLNNHAGAN